LKLLRNLIIALVLFSASNLFAYSVNTVGNIAVSDSINLMAEFSLFYEAHRNNQFDEWTMEKGWNVINTDPTQFVKYKLFTRMEEVIVALHDDENATDEMKTAFADTILALYAKAIQYDPDKESYYMVKKAYFLENWFSVEPQVVIDAYLAAFEKDWSLDELYKDRLGQFYVNNDMKMQAIDWYDKLATDEPDNARWPARLEGIVDSPEELLSIFDRSWKNDINNVEKAWKVGSQAVRLKDYVKAKEAFEYLTNNNPDVINYWKQVATVYDKLGETDNSISAYKTLIQLEPDNRDNYVNIALVYKKISQLSIARSYLNKASKADPGWDFPIYIEASLYEQAARECMDGKLEFIDKVVFGLAIETYGSARAKGGSYASTCAERMASLKPTAPTQEDYFFRKVSNGDQVKIEGKCYDWIGRSITARF